MKIRSYKMKLAKLSKQRFDYRNSWTRRGFFVNE